MMDDLAKTVVKMPPRSVKPAALAAEVDATAAILEPRLSRPLEDAGREDDDGLSNPSGVEKSAGGKWSARLQVESSRFWNHPLTQLQGNANVVEMSKITVPPSILVSHSPL